MSGIPLHDSVTTFNSNRADYSILCKPLAIISPFMKFVSVSSF